MSGDADRAMEQIALEAICDRGCRYANESIEALEAGRYLPEAELLSPTQRGHLLEELRGIMAIYTRCQ